MLNDISCKPVWVALWVLFAAAATGCGAGDTCTLIGCEDGVNLRLEDPKGKPISAFRGSVTLGDKVISVECGPGGAEGDPAYFCQPDGVFLRGSGGTKLSADLHASDDPGLVYIGEVRVDYEPQYPNGEKCGAACHQASTTLVLEPLSATQG